MPGAPSAWRSLRPCEVTSRVCGHAYEYLVSSKTSGYGKRNRESEIAYLESVACVDCRDAASKAEWVQKVADAEARGFTGRSEWGVWVHSCGARFPYGEPPASCGKC